MYSDDCDCGEHHNHKPNTILLAGGYRDILNDFLKQVHSGELKPGSIQPDYYNNLATKLAGAVAEGLGGKIFASDDDRNALKAYFDHNIYVFSGAKSLVMLKEYNRLLLDDKGQVLPYKEFEKRALKVDALYNKTYLEAEYEMAVASSQIGASWPGLMKFKLLEWSTTGGENVCPICGGFDRMIIASNNPVLNRLCPPLHFKCHCKFIPAADTDTPTPEDHINNVEKAADIKPYFKNNPGKNKVIFTDGHPYFKNLGNNKQRELDAEKNYNMPSGERIYATINLTSYTEAKSKEEANKWWTDTAGGQRKTIDIIARDGITVSMDNRFRNHVLEENKDNRYRFLPPLPDILKNPDEVWSNKIKGTIQTAYIKYYKNCPIVIVTDSRSNVTAITAYEVQKNGRTNFGALANMRKGILKYKK
ncbi:PBECR2 nuclease fold domain-containing protein [Mucilaginibacter kameinonensis]|uniref:PBECR2 nuclease fold domain-containing protein n=1 Tax=Mucilaginibacter kameinonensis TaxID=452286 RepID=UPI000EF7C3C6|nr:PBECR2 nuclease fold domain-containing protein [Mucilaginibacter kameinonensis]